MYDQWCYYYRLSVVMLFEGLPRGSYTARIWLDALQPNREFTRRPAPPGIQVRKPSDVGVSAYLLTDWASGRASGAKKSSRREAESSDSIK